MRQVYCGRLQLWSARLRADPEPTLTFSLCDDRGQRVWEPFAITRGAS